MTDRWTIHDYDDCADYAAPDRFIVTAQLINGLSGEAIVCKDRDGCEAVYHSWEAAEADANKWAAVNGERVRYTVERY